MGYIEGEDRNQIILFPESIDEYVSDNQLKELVFSIFLHLNINTTKDLKNPSFLQKCFRMKNLESIEMGRKNI